jgi:hypothetical protein
MALSKSVDTTYGIAATYWNIGVVQEDYKDQIIDITMYGYATEQSRRDGKSPFSIEKIQITGTEYVADAQRPALYAIIKQRPEFSGATDA